MQIGRLGLIGLFLAGGCAPNPHVANSATNDRCSASLPLNWARVDALAGRYRLTLVTTTTHLESPVVMNLSLRVNDSASRHAPRFIGRFPGERPLVGSADVGPATASPSTAPVPVALIDSTLFVGGIDMPDGAGYRLRVQRVGVASFAGTWSWDGGITIAVDPVTHREVQYSGSFCAERMPSGGA